MDAESFGSETILVVEDEAFVRAVTCEILRSAGYAILSAANASEAESVFFTCDKKIALLFTDIVLPGENGFVLAARLKQTCPSLKVLFATGYPEQISWGMDYLEKPFSAATLLESVARMLGHVQREFSSELVTTRACDNAPRPGSVQGFPIEARFA